MNAFFSTVPTIRLRGSGRCSAPACSIRPDGRASSGARPRATVPWVCRESSRSLTGRL